MTIILVIGVMVLVAVVIAACSGSHKRTSDSPWWIIIAPEKPATSSGGGESFLSILFGLALLAGLAYCAWLAIAWFWAMFVVALPYLLVIGGGLRSWRSSPACSARPDLAPSRPACRLASPPSANEKG